MATGRATRSTVSRRNRNDDEEGPRGRSTNRSTEGGKKPAKKSRALSLDPEDNLQFGLIDDTDFTITGAWYAPWNMNGKLERDGTPFHLLGLCIEYDIGEEDPHVETYSAGYLDSYAPSEDGVDPAGGDDNDYLDLNSGDMEEAAEDMRGPWKIPVRQEGKSEKPAGSKRTGEHFFFETLRKAANAAGVEIAFKNEDGSPRNVEEILVGISGHLMRLKQREEDKNGILVPEQVYEKEEAEGGGGGKKGKKSSSGKTSRKRAAEVDEDEEDEEESKEQEEKPVRRSSGRRSSSSKAATTTRRRSRADENEEEEEESEEEETTTRSRVGKSGDKTSSKPSGKLPDDIDEQVDAAIISMIDEAGGKIRKAELGDIADKFEKRQEKQYALKCIGDPDYLGAIEGVEYDAYKQILTLEEE